MISFLMLRQRQLLETEPILGADSGHRTIPATTNRPQVWNLIGFVLALLSISFETQAPAQDYENEPINYMTATADNAVSRLQNRLDDQKSQLTVEKPCGYLASVLRELEIPISSQTLVFSKTSLQRQWITPGTPRALYFNDDIYVGFCQNSRVMEISAADPGLGTAFYTFTQHSAEVPRFVRQTDNCLACHGTTNTRGVPGNLIRSVYVDGDGFPILSMGTHRVDHSSPITKRWGGWYVTGTHHAQTHLGNLVVANSTSENSVDNSAGQNVVDLRSRFETSGYLSPHSDLVALMVLEHQVEAQNLLIRTSFQTRQALYSEARLNKELGEPVGHRWDSTTTRIKSSCDSLLKYLLFCDETRLTGPIRGTTHFAEEFAQRGPRDIQGRSLRDFDLEHRLFKYPLSYQIYSRLFDALPTEAKDYFYRRLWNVLSGHDDSRDFSHLSDADKTAILEILRDTKPGLPEYFRPASSN